MAAISDTNGKELKFYGPKKKFTKLKSLEEAEEIDALNAVNTLIEHRNGEMKIADHYIEMCKETVVAKREEIELFLWST